MTVLTPRYEHRKCLNGIRMRRLVPLQPIQCLPTDLARLDCRLAVFRDVFARSNVVVQSEESLDDSRAEDLVGQHVIRKKVGGGMVRDLVGWADGSEAEDAHD